MHSSYWPDHNQEPQALAADVFADITENNAELLEISGPVLLEILHSLSRRELLQALQHHVIPVATLPGTTYYASVGEEGQRFAAQKNYTLVAHVSPPVFHEAIRQCWGKLLITHATHALKATKPQFSAFHRLSTFQTFLICSVIVILSLLSTILSFTNLWLLVSFIFACFFLSLLSLKLLCLLPQQAVEPRHILNLRDEDLPSYSVLVPVFREVAVLDQLLGAMTSLSYPPEKLDIKIIVEENDIHMRRALGGRALPHYMEVIIVPVGQPQTKPRALNYALQFARGEFLTIYDAEDIPEPDQLRRVAAKFYHTAQDVACMQAQLVFFNVNENWITRQFAAEYAILFGSILPALASYGLPLPLGGTSNHFRTEILRSVGAWDPFNVTEDADLGFRLARIGYQTETIASLTYEEANTRVMNWIHQRARWFKGFLLTFLVHMRDPLETGKALGLAGTWVMISMSFGAFVSALLHPLLFLGTLFIFMQSMFLEVVWTPWRYILSGIDLAVFLMGFIVAIVVEVKVIKKLGIENIFATLMSLPLYGLMGTAAAWVALWQFIKAPHSWNKTEHGLSVFQTPPKT